MGFFFQNVKTTSLSQPNINSAFCCFSSGKVRILDLFGVRDHCSQEQDPHTLSNKDPYPLGIRGHLNIDKLVGK